MAASAKALPTMVICGEQTNLQVGLEVGLVSDASDINKSLRYKVIKMDAKDGITVERDNGCGKSRVPGLKPSHIKRIGF